MTPVTRYQADDGSLHETEEACREHERRLTQGIPPRPPPDQWGLWDSGVGGWFDNLDDGPELFDSREMAEHELILHQYHDKWIAAQYSARPPAPETAP